jgi:hypothetical protein
MQTRDAPLMALRRSLRSRRLSAQGAARQRALLGFDERFARTWARRLPPDAVDLTVSQTLLPFLWRDGVLGGRTFDVLLTRFPLAELQQRLDRAAALHPESPTLADFRADPALVEAEQEALAAARRLVTPHAELATLAGDRVEPLSWALPHVEQTRRGGDAVVFPAPALGRKGAYELRTAARELDVEIVVIGPPLEGPAFWDGVRTRTPRGNWLQEARCVVLPSFVESRPSALLTALAAGLPVVATPACGLPPGDLVTIVPAGDPAALVQALSV